MVDLDSGRVSRAPPYSGFRRSLSRFGYAAFTLFDAPSQKLLLQESFLITPHAVLHPRLMRFGLLPVRSPLLGESLLISIPELLRWFTSLSVAPVTYVFSHQVLASRLADYSIRKSGGKRICAPVPSLSQLITSFFASQLQGIHHKPIFA